LGWDEFRELDVKIEAKNGFGLGIRTWGEKDFGEKRNLKSM